MADETTTTTLIRTKLHRFALPEGHVHRPRLLERLDQNRQRPLTLVSASAGSGKSSLVSCWLQECASLHRWVSLDNNDNDLNLFLNYFLAAIKTMFPDVASLQTESSAGFRCLEQKYLIKLKPICHMKERPL